MIRPPLYTQELFDCRDKSLVGGKAENLGRLIRAGFPVPGGFVVTTRAYRAVNSEAGVCDLVGAGLALPPARSEGGIVGAGLAPPFPRSEEGRASPAPTDGREASVAGTAGPTGGSAGGSSFRGDVAEQIRLAYELMGRGPVAVRSSATAEDGSAASMAGQYETFLHVNDERSLLEAVRFCWASLDSPRTRAYLADRGIDIAQVAMAVVVQRLVPAAVAGVLFTANPQSGTRAEMLVEASWGLGEAVVSGRVQPDVLRLDAGTGRVIDATIADKRVHITSEGHEERPVVEDRRRTACLRSGDVDRLWKLGRRAAEYFGSPQDLEWAIDGPGELYLLQSRPITTLAEAETYEELLRTTREELRERLAAGRGPWVLHNLAETLPHPTSLTWSVIRRFMTGDGGFGRMYRSVGFEPSEAARRDGFLDLVAGRVYMDASRGPEMFFEGFPFRYDLEQLRRDPDAGQAPPTVPAGSMGARMRIGRKLAAVNDRLREVAADFDVRLRDQIIPAFVEWCRQEKQRDLSELSSPELIELWHTRERRVLDEFAPDSLLPSLISGMALADLRAFLDEHFWDDDPDALAQLLSSAAPPDRTAQSDALLYAVGRGERPLADWVAEYGHRAAGEFDLAAPRWREQPEQVATMAARLRDGIDPAERHRAHAQSVKSRLDALRAPLAPSDRAELDRLLSLLWRYVPYREDGKYYLMVGYELLRDVALEAGRRLEVGEDVFLLTLEDLIDALRVGFAPHHLIAQRKAARRAEAKVTVPRLIDASAVETLGEPPRLQAGSASYKAFALSSGAAAGPARIVRSPQEAGDLGRGYILVCPSTDPAWTPLFVNAAGLVLECGGTLSHGAVVAREMGLPAVVLPDATRIFTDGEAIHVDGRSGHVSRNDDVGAAPAPEASRTAGAGAGLARPPSDQQDRGQANVHTPSPLYSGERAGVRGLARAALNIVPRYPRDRPLTLSLSPEYRGEGTSRGSRSPESGATSADPQDIHVPRTLVPPPPGRRERSAARLRNIAFAVWGIYLLAAFLLPDTWVYHPSLHGLDLALWPLLRAAGPATTVVIIAALVAALTMLVQRYFTDNARLLEAKRRAAALAREANGLPSDSPRHGALLRLAGPVHWRVAAAAFVPLALLLGPMVMSFSWLHERILPTHGSIPPGATVQVVALVNSDLRTPVTMSVIAPLQIDAAATPAAQRLRPIKETLLRLADQLKFATPAPQKPGAVADWARDEAAREAALASLQAYLDRDIPPQPLRWSIRTPPGVQGRFSLTVTASPDGPPVKTTLVVGDRPPPAPAQVDGPGRSAVRSIEINYPKVKTREDVWRPLRWMPAEWQWVVLYLLAYLPVMFGLRAALRVA